MIGAVVFDMDGVLLDSEPLWQRAEIEEFGAVGISLTVADCVQTMGQRVDEVVAHWFERRPWTGPTVAEVADRLVERVRALVLSEADPLPGVDAIVAALAGRGVPLALATSSPMRLVDAVLVRFALRPAFTAIASAEHEPFGKPHPAVYLTAARRLGVPPTACVAIEDSVNGVISAKAARMRCIAVPDAGQRSDPRFAIADATVGSLTDALALLDEWAAT